jgi:hypothetical protein
MKIWSSRFYSTAFQAAFSWRPGCVATKSKNNKQTQRRDFMLNPNINARIDGRRQTGFWRSDGEETEVSALQSSVWFSRVSKAETWWTQQLGGAGQMWTATMGCVVIWSNIQRNTSWHALYEFLLVKLFSKPQNCLELFIGAELSEDITLF